MRAKPGHKPNKGNCILDLIEIRKHLLGDFNSSLADKFSFPSVNSSYYSPTGENNRYCLGDAGNRGSTPFLRLRDKASLGTIQKELSTLKSALNQAIEWEWLELSPFRRFKIQPAYNQKERWLTAEEELKLLNASPAWLQEVIVFLLNTGMRRGGLLTLKWPEVDLERKTVQLLITKNKTKRTIPMNQTVVDLLKLKMQVRQNSGYVFTSGNGTKLDGTNLYHSFVRARKKAELLDVRLHDLRHTIASRLVQAGVNLYSVQLLLGHKDGRITQRYAHHSIDSLRHDIELLRHKSDTPEDDVEAGVEISQ